MKRNICASILLNFFGLLSEHSSVVMQRAAVSHDSRQERELCAAVASLDWMVQVARTAEPLGMGAESVGRRRIVLG